MNIFTRHSDLTSFSSHLDMGVRVRPGQRFLEQFLRLQLVIKQGVKE